MDGGIGVDMVEKEKILQDGRNKFIWYIYRFAFGDNYQGLRMPFPYQ